MDQVAQRDGRIAELEAALAAAEAARDESAKRCDAAGARCQRLQRGKQDAELRLRRALAECDALRQQQPQQQGAPPRPRPAPESPRGVGAVGRRLPDDALRRLKAEADPDPRRRREPTGDDLDNIRWLLTKRGAMVRELQALHRLLQRAERGDGDQPPSPRSPSAQSLALRQCRHLLSEYLLPVEKLEIGFMSSAVRPYLPSSAFESASPPPGHRRTGSDPGGFDEPYSPPRDGRQGSMPGSPRGVLDDDRARRQFTRMLQITPLAQPQRGSRRS
eukprot:TRINITY_DN11696_c1_g1_i1.p1 TRINITY_DN11696_c1_g1~~TRINITY_DN11696_c1_g1_i1.p1  ORF type:complete len:275 (+),score=87.78 TRINITY_DN11696_c1_g1_i1:2-826(+)